MNEILAKNIALGLANPYLAVPQEFVSFKDSNGTHLFQNTLGTRPAALEKGKYYLGSSVASSSNPGSNAQVIPLLGTYKGKNDTPRLWIKTNRNDAMSESKTIEFRLADNSSTTLAQGYSAAHLSMVVANGIVNADQEIPTDASSRNSVSEIAVPSIASLPKVTRMLYICKPRTAPINKPETAIISRDITPTRYIWYTKR